MGRNRGFSPFFIYSQSRRKEVCQLSSSAARGVVQKDEYVDSRTFVKLIDIKEITEIRIEGERFWKK